MGVQLEYLPAYSPNFNPIEQSFLAIKAYIQ
jgi:transposase